MATRVPRSRQPPGARAVVGALAALSLVWVVPLRVWLVALVMGTGLHIAVNAIFVLLGVKRRVF
jgi:hypothetical protein